MNKHQAEQLDLTFQANDEWIEETDALIIEAQNESDLDLYQMTEQMEKGFILV